MTSREHAIWAAVFAALLLSNGYQALTHLGHGDAGQAALSAFFAGASASMLTYEAAMAVAKR